MPVYSMGSIRTNIQNKEYNKASTIVAFKPGQ